MENVSLMVLKSLNRQGIIDLYRDLNIPFPPEADLEYLRSYLRLVKLNKDKGSGSSQVEGYVTPVAPYEPLVVYNNQEVIAHELLFNTGFENIYEDVAESLSYAELGLPLRQAQSQPLDNVVNMAEKVACFIPQTFSGKPTENIKGILSHYERVATANSWDDRRKLQLLPLYLTDTALIVFENLERDLGDGITWDLAKQAFLKKFSLTTNTEVL